MAAQQTAQNPKEHFQQIKVLWMALLSGQVMILLVLYFFVGPEPTSGAEETVSEFGGFDTFTIIGSMIFLATVSGGFFMYNRRKLEGGNLKGSLMEKIEHYRASFIIRAALIEGGVLCMILFNFFLQEHILFLGLAILGIGLFLFIRPSANQFRKDYELSGSEQSELTSALI